MGAGAPLIIKGQESKVKRIDCRKLLVQVVALLLGTGSALAQGNPTVLVDVDHRKAMSLDGDWHYIVDPYEKGLYTFHREVRKDGFFLNGAPEAGSDGLIEYDFARSPTLKVPGDWNTQSDLLYYYEGLLWYQRDFDFKPSPGHKTFLHIGAANYKSTAWVNGKQACSHEGGFTAFDCDVSASVHAGRNFVVIAVNNTRLADGVPTLSTDWWNYGGLTRDVSLVDVPDRYIDDYDLHLNRARTAIEGSVHVEGGAPGSPVTVSLPELKRTVTATVGRRWTRADFHRCRRPGTLDAGASAPLHRPPAGGRRRARRPDGFSHGRGERDRHPAERQAGVPARRVDPR